ncbi:M24 family metallopeptidase [Haloarchaeobius amylolyticus]|uniref:M24 family metallopeptidase n=1 Tax=Haloarchaeobius amylolyticus TaxID=1198296 RepID=UPI00226E1D83|nr:M24 family metallopeptidase [Haloarchaeobius amylolyticus]
MSLSIDFEPVQRELRDRDACAFVHVGREADPTLRSLARTAHLEGELAVVVTADQALLLAPEAPDAAAEAYPDAQILPAGEDIPTGTRVATVLDDLGLSGTVLAPRTIPHDAALYLENEGFEVASTAAVEDAREAKTDAEQLRQTTVQSAACAGMRRVAAVLAAAEPGDLTEDGHGHGHGHDSSPHPEPDDHDHDGPLIWEDAPLTALRLRREADAAMAAEGVAPGTTSIGVAGRTATPRSDDPIEPGDTVVVDLAPHGPDGYHGRLVRTFVVDGDGGWTRRAQLAVETALDAALGELEPGVTAGAVLTELEAEVAAYGFDGDETAAYGVGLERREAPLLGELPDDTELDAGTVLALDAGVTDAEEGTVRLAELVAITDDGGRALGAFPRSLSP